MIIQKPSMNRLLIYFSSITAALGYTFSIGLSRLGMYAWLSSIFFIIFIIYFVFFGRRDEEEQKKSQI